MVDYDTCYSHSERCCDVAERTVDLCLGRAPFVLHESLVAHVLHRLFLAVYADELASREGFVLLESLAQASCQRVALHLPEFSLSDHEGVAAQGCTHG